MSRGHRQLVKGAQGHTGRHRVSVANLDVQGEHRFTVKVIHPMHPHAEKVKVHKARKIKIRKQRTRKANYWDSQ